jgi:hypothetical protein
MSNKYQFHNKDLHFHKEMVNKQVEKLVRAYCLLRRQRL